MSDIKLFQVTDEVVREIHGEAVTLEKSLQNLIERNLSDLLGISFLASEYTTGKQHGGRIDTLGIDENGSPVIIEYKRSTNENVINQGLFYLDWLMDHRGEFELLVLKSLGKEVADDIDWSAPRLLCIAGDFTRYDEHAVRQMDRNIELLRYKRFGADLLLFEQLTSGIDATPAASRATPRPDTPGRSALFDSLEGDLKDLWEALRAFLEGLGDEVTVKTLKHYIAFRRLKNFACVEPVPTKRILTIYARVDPDTVETDGRFTRDVRNIGHHGTGELEINIRSTDELEKAEPLLRRAYEGA